MTFELVEDAKGDPRNAMYLGVASDLAYLPEATGKIAYREQLGLDARLISVGNTQVYVGANDDHIVAAFRGTEAPTSIEGLKDWLLSDAMNLLIVPEGDLGTDFVAAGVGTRWHQGFIKAIGDIWNPFLEAIETERKKSDRPLWLTGHSLGGALALLAGWRLKRKFISVHQIYTFGGPMVGNAAAAEAIDREFGDKIFRYVNYQDPIPQLPTVSLLANQYGHCQKEVDIGVVATASEAALSAANLFQQMAAKTVDGVLQGSLIDDFWNELQSRVGAHAMENYRAHLKELFNK